MNFCWGVCDCIPRVVILGRSWYDFSQHSIAADPLFIFTDVRVRPLDDSRIYPALSAVDVLEAESSNDRYSVTVYFFFSILLLLNRILNIFATTWEDCYLFYANIMLWHLYFNINLWLSKYLKYKLSKFITFSGKIKAN